MQKQLVPFLVLLASSVASAQSYSYSPDPYAATREGDGWATSFGRYREMRVQHIDGNFHATAKTISELAYRAEGGIWSGANGIGRTWSNVSILAGASDLAKVSSTYTANFPTTPTLVYSANTSFPTQTTQSRLTSWPAFNIRFPFSSKFTKPSSADLCLQFEFVGGTFSNNYSGASLPYYLDASRFGSYASSALTLAYGTRKCKNSGSANAAYCDLTLFNIGPNYTTTSYRNTMRAAISGGGIGKSNAFYSLIGLKEVAAGVYFPGVSCQRLYIDTSFPIALMRGVSQSWDNFSLTVADVPSNSSWVGTKVIAQTAWLDTGSSALKMTPASHATVPYLPMHLDFSAAKLAVVWGFSVRSSAGSLISGSSTDVSLYPTTRYRD